jgi:soluble lytic murein transglycosylase-like protein
LLPKFPSEKELFIKPALFFLDIDENEDLILASYMNPALRDEVLVFFKGITGSLEVAEAILLNSSLNNVPPSLAFALCAEESAYNPRAFNRNRNNTEDRGLFQLNSATFPKMSIDEFYDPARNAQNGLSHLRWCLDKAGTEVAALAMYNAGHNRVSSAGTPKSTLDYISRILKRGQRIEGLFMAEYVRIVQTASTETDTAANGEKKNLRLSLLSPLGGR